MKQFPLFIFFLITVFVMSSCEGKKKSYTKHSSGKTAEMIISTNGELTWNGVVGDSIRSFFNRDFTILPQPEPLFEFVHIPIQKLKGNKMFKSHHNILIVEIDEKYSKAAIDAQKDLWASPQRVIQITAPDASSFIDFFDKKKEVILSILMDSEYERLIQTYHAFKDHSVQQAVKDNFKFKLEIPGGYYVAKKQAGFMWIRKETQHNSQGIIIYTYDFVDTLAFNHKRILEFRDAMTKEHIPGPAEGSYMVVAEDYMPAISKPINLNGMFAIETRGLWHLEGDFMGGPFVNYTFVDERNNKVVTIDTYTYAPNKPKRDLVIQLEAIVHSLKWVD